MPADPVSAGPRGDLPGVDRLLAVSDGVVANAITLLVLQLNVPAPAALTNPDSASELAAHLGKTAQQIRAARYRVAASVLVIAVSIVLAWVNPDAAKYCWLLLAVAPRFADRWSGRQAA